MGDIVLNIGTLIPDGWNIYLSNPPESDATEETDYLLISDINSVNGESNIKTPITHKVSDIQIYIKKTPYANSYTDIINLLDYIVDILYNSIGGVIGDSNIIGVRDTQTIPLGKDENGKYNFSLNMRITHK